MSKDKQEQLGNTWSLSLTMHYFSFPRASEAGPEWTLEAPKPSARALEREVTNCENMKASWVPAVTGSASSHGKDAVVAIVSSLGRLP